MIKALILLSTLISGGAVADKKLFKCEKFNNELNTQLKLIVAIEENRVSYQYKIGTRAMTIQHFTATKTTRATMAGNVSIDEGVERHCLTIVPFGTGKGKEWQISLTKAIIGSDGHLVDATAEDFFDCKHEVEG